MNKKKKLRNFNNFLKKESLGLLYKYLYFKQIEYY